MQYEQTPTRDGASPAGTIEFDEFGIPTLRADTALDVVYLQGYHVATTRAWQLDCEHRRARGMTAEVFGEHAVTWDHYARQLGLDDVARTCVDGLTDVGDRAWFAAFAAGVNHGLAQGQATSPEFEHFGRKPLPWDPHTSVAVMLGYQSLLTNFPTKLLRHNVQRDAPELAAVLFAAQAGSEGSNAWAVRTSKTGHPLLAADPHRFYEFPGIYYQVRMVCDEFDVQGLGFPGVAGTPHFGQSDHIAWVTTSALVSATDLAIEQTARPDDLMWTRDELIHVSGADPVPVTVAATPRGRLLTGVGDAPVSVRLATDISGRCGLETTRDLMGARSAQQAAKCWDGWVEPINRLIIADKDTVVTRHAGLVPQRLVGERGRPAAVASAVPAAEFEPVTGWHEWPPADEVTDRVVAANEAHIQTASLTVDHCSDSRLTRIEQLLATTSAATVDEFAEFQHDAVVDPSELRWLRDAATLHEGVAKLAERWDGSLAAGSVDGASVMQLGHRIAADVIGRLPSVVRQYGGGVWAPWLDAGLYIPVALDEHGLLAVVEAIGAADDAGSIVSKAWDAAGQEEPWQSVHGVRAYSHATEYGDLGRDPSAAEQLHTEILAATGLGGSAHCVCATSHLPGFATTTSRGPVARVIFDLADRSNSRWVVPFGADSSGHAMDQWPLYREGKTLPIMAQPRACREVARPTPVEGRVVVRTFDGYDESLTCARVRPDSDAVTIARWAGESRAQFWGMMDASVEEVRGVYEYLDYQPTHDTYLSFLGTQPVSLLQVYEAHAEPIADVYDVQPGDLGLHFMTNPKRLLSGGDSARLYVEILQWLLGRDGVERLVIEPAKENKAARRAALRVGFREIGEVELPDKTAILCVLTRADLMATLQKYEESLQPR